MFCQTAARRYPFEALLRPVDVRPPSISAHGARLPALKSRRRPLTVRLFGERAQYARRTGDIRKKDRDLRLGHSVLLKQDLNLRPPD